MNAGMSKEEKAARREEMIKALQEALGYLTGDV
jgi:hypothetical protein